MSTTSENTALNSASLLEPRVGGPGRGIARGELKAKAKTVITHENGLLLAEQVKRVAAT